MPADQSRWLDDQQCAAPVKEATKRREHEAIRSGCGRGSLLAFLE
jgi:hypothetical protein